MTATWKVELIPVPVTDVDRAKAFYERIGFNADHDHTVHEFCGSCSSRRPVRRAPSRSATG